MSTVDVTSQAQPLVVEVPGQVNQTGQSLPVGAEGQTLKYTGGQWQPGPRLTVSTSAPSGGDNGDIWFVVP